MLGPVGLVGPFGSLGLLGLVGPVGFGRAVHGLLELLGMWASWVSRGGQRHRGRVIVLGMRVWPPESPPDWWGCSVGSRGLCTVWFGCVGFPPGFLLHIHPEGRDERGCPVGFDDHFPPRIVHLSVVHAAKHDQVADTSRMRPHHAVRTSTPEDHPIVLRLAPTTARWSSQSLAVKQKEQAGQVERPDAVRARLFWRGRSSPRSRWRTGGREA